MQSCLKKKQWSFTAKTVYAWIIINGIIFFLICGVLGWERYHFYKYVDNNCKLKTIAKFIEQGVKFHELYSFKYEEKIYFFWIEPMPRGYLHSGPPCYIFDAAGNLIDHTPDVGDSSRFQNTWCLHPKDHVFNSLNELLEFLQIHVQYP